MKKNIQLEAPSHPTRGRRRSHTVVTRTILCSDIVGAKKLYENLTGPKYSAVLDRHIDLVSKCAAEISAEFIEVDGDSVYVVMDALSLEHIDLAVAIQRAGVGLPFGYSVGISQGEVVSVFEEGTTKYEGVTIARAKALARIGSAGAVFIDSNLVSQVNLQLLGGITLGSSFKYHALPYFNSPGDVSEIIWSHQAFGVKI